MSENVPLNLVGKKLTARASNNATPAASTLPANPGECLVVYNPGPTAIAVETGDAGTVEASTDSTTHSMIVPSGVRAVFAIKASNTHIEAIAMGAAGVTQDYYIWRGRGVV